MELVIGIAVLAGWLLCLNIYVVCRFSAAVERMNREFMYYTTDRQALNDIYWKLRYSHERLLKHLNLYEEELPSKTVLKQKGGPEQAG
jgi:biopolymer transport protein ExbB/TolQ